MKKVIIATLLFTMLHSCMGCSDSQSDMEPIPVPQEEYMASDMVIYEAILAFLPKKMRSLPSKQSLTVFKAWGLPCFG